MKGFTLFLWCLLISLFLLSCELQVPAEQNGSGEELLSESEQVPSELIYDYPRADLSLYRSPNNGIGTEIATLSKNDRREGLKLDGEHDVTLGVFRIPESSSSQNASASIAAYTEHLENYLKHLGKVAEVSVPEEGLPRAEATVDGVSITSSVSSIVVGSFTDRISAETTDLELKRLLATDPYLSAACAYHSVTDPVISFFCERDENGSVSSFQFCVYQRGATLSESAENLMCRSFYVRKSEEEGRAKLVITTGSFEKVRELSALSYSDALKNLKDENCFVLGTSSERVKDEEILSVTFQYDMTMCGGYVIPTYEFLVKRDAETVLCVVSAVNFVPMEQDVSPESSME